MSTWKIVEMSRYTTVLVYTCFNWKDFELKTHGFECWGGWDRGSQGHALALYCRQWSSVKACCGPHSSHLTMTQVWVHLREQGSFCNLEWIWEQWKNVKRNFCAKNCLSGHCGPAVRFQDQVDEDENSRQYPVFRFYLNGEFRIFFPAR